MRSLSTFSLESKRNTKEFKMDSLAFFSSSAVGGCVSNLSISS